MRPRVVGARLHTGAVGCASVCDPRIDAHGIAAIIEQRDVPLVVQRNQSGRMTVPEHVDERERCSLPILSGDELLVLAQRLSK